MKLFFTITAAILTAAIIIGIVYGHNQNLHQQKIQKMETLEHAYQIHVMREMAGLPPDPNVEQQLTNQ